MAIRHASGGYLEITGAANVPTYGASTICVWGTRRVDRNATSCVMLLRDDATTGLYVGLYTTANGDSLIVSSSFGDSGVVIGLTNDAPFFVALVNNGTAFTPFAQLDSGSGIATISGVTATSTPTFDTVRIGDDSFGSWFDGDTQGVMAFNRVLSSIELAYIRRYRSPVNHDGLLFWLPEMDDATLANNRLDYSGFQRHATVVGSPTASAGASRCWEINA